MKPKGYLKFNFFVAIKIVTIIFLLIFIITSLAINKVYFTTGILVEIHVS